jgi:L-serine kinase (ADP)
VTGALGDAQIQGFIINHSLFSFELTIAELSTLHIHEEIIPEKVEALVNKILHDGLWIHPIIVDKNSFVVLDGMHRVAAAKEIGFKYIPICLVDYHNPHILIGCWYRMFKTLKEVDVAKQSLSLSGFTFDNASYDESKELVENRRATTALFSNDWSLIAYSSEVDIKLRYDQIKKVEQILQSKGYSMGYSTDKDAPICIKSGEYTAGLMTPTVTKSEVIDTALKGLVFSQKTTRHIIPARPMFVSVPVQWLYGDLTLEEVNSNLQKHLSSKKVEILSPGQILDRKYDEELYIFK